MHFSELYTLYLFTQTYRRGEKTQDKQFDLNISWHIELLFKIILQEL